MSTLLTPTRPPRHTQPQARPFGAHHNPDWSSAGPWLPCQNYQAPRVKIALWTARSTAQPHSSPLNPCAAAAAACFCHGLWCRQNLHWRVDTPEMRGSLTHRNTRTHIHTHASDLILTPTPAALHQRRPARITLILTPVSSRPLGCSSLPSAYTGSRQYSKAPASKKCRGSRPKNTTVAFLP